MIAENKTKKINGLTVDMTNWSPERIRRFEEK